jgi:hypothetical protein
VFSGVQGVVDRTVPIILGLSSFGMTFWDSSSVSGRLKGARGSGRVLGGRRSCLEGLARARSIIFVPF